MLLLNQNSLATMFFKSERGKHANKVAKKNIFRHLCSKNIFFPSFELSAILSYYYFCKNNVIFH